MRMRALGAGLAVVLALLAWVPAFAQSTTGTITGRAQDASGGLLPGVTVSITSPSMIGGARTAVTDALGSYRFGQLPPGTYKVAFELTSFRTLAIEGVVVNANATATVNGPLQLDTLEESITVTSATPTIDLQNSEVAVNWSEAQMENLPYGRGIRGLARLVPGLSPTQFDVGGNTVGGSTTTGARSYGRNGGELIQFDGVVWDQFFGDYNTYEQVFLTADQVGDASNFLLENLEVEILFFEDRPLGISIPNFVDLVITEAEPWAKGDSVTGNNKPVVVETGYRIMVPAFVEEGDKIRVDTRTGEYLTRVKD